MMLVVVSGLGGLYSLTQGSVEFFSHAARGVFGLLCYVAGDAWEWALKREPRTADDNLDQRTREREAKMAELRAEANRRGGA